jgi:hypothetical protein
VAFQDAFPIFQTADLSRAAAFYCGERLATVVDPDGNEIHLGQRG